MGGGINKEGLAFREDTEVGEDTVLVAGVVVGIEAING